MRDFTQDNLTEAVLAEIKDTTDPRTKQIMEAAFRHVHAFAREVELTLEELLQASAFLTKLGQISDPTRHEFLLLSDTIGLTMLVDAMENRKPPGATESSVLGPFYRNGAPEIESGDDIDIAGNSGVPTVVSGRVTSTDGTPLAGALLDIWQAADTGFYENVDPSQPDMNLRGRLKTDADGKYWFRTVKPSSYPIPADGPVGRMLNASGRHNMRPAHIHFILTAEGHKMVTTQLYVDGDEFIDSDVVFGVKDSLVVDFVKHDSAEEAKKLGVSAPFYTLDHDFVLEPGVGHDMPSFSAGGAEMQTADAD